MVIKKIIRKRILTICIVLLFLGVGIHFLATKTNTLSQGLFGPTPTPTPQTPFGIYQAPKISRKDFYTIVMVGDSMTNILGIHGGKLSEYLNQLYQSVPGHQRILIDNYAIGSKSILDLSNQMTTRITNGDTVLAPLMSRQFDLILIESFGYNPLSQFPRLVGLSKQAQILDKTMKQLIMQHPESAVMFVATIAPNKETYAENEQIGNETDRIAEAEERIAYIQNHMIFAKAHAIPLIDIFDNSVTPSGDGNLLYINASDHIHPSPAGIDFIAHQIGDFIYSSKVLPQ